MKQIKRLLLWYTLLTKRLLKRPAYLAVLLLAPLLTIAVTLSAGGDSGVVTIAVASEDPADPVAEETTQRLLIVKSILRFAPYADAAEAREAVETGRADAAWIFRANATEELERYAEKGRGSIVTVIEREDNVFLKLAREKLYAALYPRLSYTVFSRFVRRLPDVPELPEEALAQYYDSGTMKDGIVRIVYADGGTLENADSYLIAPLRGLLSLLIVLGGFASGMYCFREEREETYVWLSEGKRRLLPLFIHLTAILPVGAAVLVSLYVAGVGTWLPHELLLLLCFSVASAAFCELVRSLCGNEAQLGALIPILTVAMLVLCPVFLDFKLLRPLQYLLPPFYYLNGVYHPSYLPAMALYAGVTAALALVVGGRRRSG